MKTVLTFRDRNYHSMPKYKDLLYISIEYKWSLYFGTYPEPKYNNLLYINILFKRSLYFGTEWCSSTVRSAILCVSTTKKSDNNQPTKKKSPPKADASTHRRIT